MAKNPLPGCPCWYFFMFWPFLVKLSQKKVHWFWKKLWKTITNEIQVPHYNLHHTIFAAHGLDPRPYDVGISLPCSIVKSSIVVYLDTRIRSKSSVRPGCALDGSCKTAPHTLYITICGMYISALHHRLGMVSAPFSCQACNSLFLSLFLLAWVFIQKP